MSAENVQDPIAALVDHKLQVFISCHIIFFSSVSVWGRVTDIKHCGVEVKVTNFDIRRDWPSISSTSSCVISGKLHNLSEPQCLQL